MDNAAFHKKVVLQNLAGKYLQELIFAAVFAWIQSYWVQAGCFEAKYCWLRSSIWLHFTSSGCRFRRQLAISLLQSSPSSAQCTVSHLCTEMRVISVSHFLLGESAQKSPFKRFSGPWAFLSALVSPSVPLLCRRSSLKPCWILELTYEFKV